MVEFKTWKDYYIFLKEYCRFSCLNCNYGGKELDLDEEHSDGEYARVFCTEHMSMIRFDFQYLCGKWRNRENGKFLEEYGDEQVLSLSDEVIDILNDTHKKWTIDEIRELVESHESERTD